MLLCGVSFTQMCYPAQSVRQRQARRLRLHQPALTTSGRSKTTHWAKHNHIHTLLRIIMKKPNDKEIFHITLVIKQHGTKVWSDIRYSHLILWQYLNSLPPLVLAITTWPASLLPLIIGVCQDNTERYSWEGSYRQLGVAIVTPSYPCLDPTTPQTSFPLSTLHHIAMMEYDWQLTLLIMAYSTTTMYRHNIKQQYMLLQLIFKLKI